MEKLRIVTSGISGVGDRSRGRFATPADSPLHDGTPYRGLHVRRWGLGFVRHSRTILCRAVPKLRFATFSSPYARGFQPRWRCGEAKACLPRELRAKTSANVEAEEGAAAC